MRLLNRHYCHPNNMTPTLAVFLFCTLLQAIFSKGQITEPEPQFLSGLENHRVTQGRDVFFTCGVKHLSSYKVAWIKSDTKAILAIHTHMVAQNPRLAVTHNGHDTWKLHVYNVQKNDSGTYMCQINTDPMRSELGKLDVVIPPDILPDNEPTEGSGMAIEGGTVRLKCKATGSPEPTVSWRREDSRNIILRHDGGRDKQVKTFDGEILTLTNVHRTDMGAYLCIAKNGVPPPVSKRFEVVVHFHPLIKVTNQLLASPILSDVLVQCYVEASPKAMNHWMRDTGEKLIPTDKYVMEETIINEYSLQMNLTIKNLEKTDFGSYICTSSNALGKAEGVVRLQELHLAVKSTSTVSTPKYIETKPRKPVHKEKNKKWKQLKKKENENKNDDKQENSTLVQTEVKTQSPTATLMTTVKTPSWILLQRNSGDSRVKTVIIMSIFIEFTILIVSFKVIIS